MSKNFKKQVFEIVRTHRKMVTELEESGLETIADIAGEITKAIKKARRFISAATAVRLRMLSISRRNS